MPLGFVLYYSVLCNLLIRSFDLLVYIKSFVHALNLNLNQVKISTESTDQQVANQVVHVFIGKKQELSHVR